MAPKNNEEKKQRMQDLRDKTSVLTSDPFILSDGNLTNWLEDKKFKVDKAYDAIDLTLKWRKENNIDNILDETFDESWLPMKYEFIGNDKVGRPVILTYSRFAEITEQMASDAIEKALADKPKTTRYSWFFSEKVLQAIKNAPTNPNDPINSVTFVTDMKCVKFTDYTKYVKKLLPFMLENLKTLEANYPGLMYEYIILNAPKKAIRLVLALLRPVMNTVMLDKIHVYGRKDHKWIPILLEKMDASILPSRYGGTKENPVAES